MTLNPELLEDLVVMAKDCLRKPKGLRAYYDDRVFEYIADHTGFNYAHYLKIYQSTKQELLKQKEADMPIPVSFRH